MLAAGGTGGHLFPAFALAEELGRRGIAVDLVTDDRGDRYGTDFPARAIHSVPSATLAGRSVGAVAKTGLALMSGVRVAYTLLGKVRPAAVIGFGGYPTFPPLVAAKLRRIPTAIHEANAVLGRANKMLAPRVSRIAGRDHWPEAGAAVLAGGGFRVGQAIGETDSQAGQAISKPYTPANIFANLYRHLGIDSANTIPGRDGRPMHILDDRELVKELI